MSNLVIFRSVDDLVADIAAEAGEHSDSDGNDVRDIHGSDVDIRGDGVIHSDKDDRGAILCRPHQFGKLSTIEAENNNIDCFFSNSEKVKILRRLN